MSLRCVKNNNNNKTKKPSSLRKTEAALRILRKMKRRLEPACRYQENTVLDV